MSNLVKKYNDTISKDIQKVVNLRYQTITRVINSEFWNSPNCKLHSLIVGSYGRNTAINTSDVDILVELPSFLFDRYNNLSGNSQSKLLQAVRSAILNAYPRSDVRADGQVVKIAFSDEMNFEIVPAFESLNEGYKYPDSNTGGSWRSTNPKAEQEAVANKNNLSNGLLCDTCKHIRTIRDSKFSSYHLSGIVIDSFVYSAIGDWGWTTCNGLPTYPPGTYERVLLDHYNSFISKNKAIFAPGSYDFVPIETSHECLGKILNYMAY